MSQQQADTSSPSPAAVALTVPLVDELPDEMRLEYQRETGAVMSNDTIMDFARSLGSDDLDPAPPPPTPVPNSAAAAAAAVAVAETTNDAVVVVPQQPQPATATAQTITAAATTSPFVPVLRPVPKKEPKIIRDIPYTKTPAPNNENFIKQYIYGQRQELDLYFPADTSSSDGGAGEIKPGTPLLIGIHGGGWRRGGRARWFYGQPTLSAFFARMGFVVASVGYRLEFPDQWRDVSSAIAFLSKKENLEGIDPALKNCDNTRVYLFGHSAGAHIASLLMTDPSYLEAAGVPLNIIQGAICISGIYTVRNPFTNDGGPSNWRNAIFQRAYISGYWNTGLEILDTMSPAWRIAQFLGPEAVTLVAKATNVAPPVPGFLEGCTGCSSVEVRAQPNVAAATTSKTNNNISKNDDDDTEDANRKKQATAETTVAVVATASPQLSREQLDRNGYGTTLVALRPTLLHTVPIIVLSADSDLGLECDAHRFVGLLKKLPGARVHFATIPGTNHQSVCTSEATAVTLQKLMTAPDSFFPPK